MIFLQLIAWLHPLLLILFSFLAYRHLPWRHERFIGYFLFLFAAFLMDIFGLSFKIDLIDIIAQRLILFMIAEYLWAISAIRHRRSMTAALVAISLFTGMCTWRWLAAGPGGVHRIWNSRMESTYHHGANRYALKSRRFLTLRGRTRRWVLSRYLRHTPFELRVDDWVTYPGYAETPFSFSWQPNGAGVKLDLIDAGAAIWSLGEGL